MFSSNNSAIRVLPVTLVVVHTSDPRGAKREPTRIGGVHYVDFADLCDETMDRIRPGVVLSQLFDARFDALDVAQFLDRCGYSGAYCAVGKVASPQMIRQEVMARAPLVQFDVLDAADLADALRQAD